MSNDGEEYLKEAQKHFQASDFKKAKKAAEKARKQFLKDDLPARASEALRVMADATLNAREMKTAKKLYEELLKEGQSTSNIWFQSAAHWGLGQVALHSMDYRTAQGLFDTGLKEARSIADQWFTGWNAYGLGIAYRGSAKLDEARSVLKEAVDNFQAMGQSVFVTRVKKVLDEIGGDDAEPRGDTKVWLCPMCGSKFSMTQAKAMSGGGMATCEYCGTTVG